MNQHKDLGMEFLFLGTATGRRGQQVLDSIENKTCEQDHFTGGEFADSITQDMRAPLRSIQGFAERYLDLESDLGKRPRFLD